MAVQLIEKCGELSADSLSQMAGALDGTFTITVLDAANTMYFVRGNNPLTIRFLPRLGCYLYASTDEILDTALDDLRLSKLRQTNIPITQGNIMVIDAQGQRTVTRFDDAHLQRPRYFCDWVWHSQAVPDEPEHDDYMEMVLEYGKRHGVSEQELRLLMDAGYDAMDLEELIYDDQFRETCIREIMADFGVY